MDGRDSDALQIALNWHKLTYWAILSIGVTWLTAPLERQLFQAAALDCKLLLLYCRRDFETSEDALTKIAFYTTLEGN